MVVVRVDPRTLKLPRAPARLGAEGHPGLLADLHPRGLRGRPLPLPASTSSSPRARRSSARATTRPSTCARPPSRSSGPPPGRCRSCRSTIDARRDARGRRPALGLGRAGVVGRQAMSGLEREADVVAAIDRRLGAGRVARKALRYVFPDHWSFLLGEIALYAFLVLVATGVYLALFFSPDVSGTVVYHGPLQTAAGRGDDAGLPLDARPLLDVPGGLLMRQTHHWAALVFVAAMVVHLLRVFFTGAFRRPRELNWLLGVGLLATGRARGLRRLLAARRPARGHGPGHRLRGRAVDPVARRVDRRARLGRPVPRPRGDREPPLHRPRLRPARRHGRG